MTRLPQVMEDLLHPCLLETLRRLNPLEVRHLNTVPLSEVHNGKSPL